MPANKMNYAVVANSTKGFTSDAQTLNWVIDYSYKAAALGFNVENISKEQKAEMDKFEISDYDKKQLSALYAPKLEEGFSILLTAEEFSQVKNEASKIGNGAYLIKFLKVDDVLNKIEKLK